MTDAILRHALELTLVVPGSIICLLPVRKKLRYPGGVVFLITAIVELSFISAAAALCAKYTLPSVYTMLAALPLFFALYLGSVRERWSKLLFCFCAAFMLCSFCVMYTNFLAAPWEIDEYITFSPRSSLICLGIGFLCLLLYARALSVELPYLFAISHLDGAWLWLSLACLVLAGMFYWLEPTDLSNMLVGRIRMICLVVFPLFPLAILLICYLCHRLARRLARQSALAQENAVLRMEARRYRDLSRYQQEARILRHDFRQHLNVIAEFAQAGRKQELLDYLSQLEAAPGQTSITYCANPAADAVVAHYARIAAAQSTVMLWTLELPETLPMPEAAFCGLLGNLLDNALRAVAALPEAERKVEVICRMLSPKMMGLSVENPYQGKVRLRPDGLPATRQKGHGLGLVSVRSTVRRYNGTLKIDSSNGRFTVDILMNF